MPENPYAGHRKRIRERFRKSGLDNFADHEVLEFILFHFYTRKDTKQDARDFINKFGSLNNLFDADIETIIQTLNCTENLATFLNLIPAIAGRYSRSKWGAKIILDSEELAGQYATDLLSTANEENFYVFCLDKNYKLLQAAKISKGTVDETAVYPREIIKEAIKFNATKIILAHNHPAGTFRPSRSDLEITRLISEHSTLFSIEVVDHIIVVGDTYYSFAARRQHVQGYL